MDTQQTEKPKYTVTYWIHFENRIALVRVSDTRVQGWIARGKEFDKDFEHSHFQTTYPSKDRLDAYLAMFQSSNIDQYLQLQFDHLQMDDYFREKANEIKDRMFKNLNPPPPPTDRVRGVTSQTTPKPPQL